MANLFADGFESGNTSAWSAVVDTETDLSVTTGAKLHGNYGLNVLIDNTTALYVRDDTPNAETRYRARFYLDPNTLTMANDDVFTILYGITDCFEIKLYYTTALGYQINMLVYKDSGSSNSSTNITDAPHCIEIDWKASTAPGNNNGYLKLWVDGILVSSLTAIDNDTKVLNSVGLGGVTGIDAGTSGTFYIDDFESNNDGGAIGEIFSTYHTDFAGLGIVTSFGWFDEATNDAHIDTLLANNIRYLREFENWDATDRYALTKLSAISATAKGAFVTFGVNCTTTLTAANWGANRTAILAAAQWAQDNGMYEFEIGNEEELHVDGTTLTVAQVIINLKALATEVQAIFTRGNVIYACSNSYISDWATAGRGDIDILASNIYIGYDGVYWEGWRTGITALINAFGVEHTYIAEFGPSSTSLADYSSSDFSQAKAVYMMLKYIKDSGMTRANYYYYGPSDDFGVIRGDGTYRLLWDVLKASAVQIGRNVATSRIAATNRLLIRDMGSNLLFLANCKVNLGADFIGQNAGSVTGWIKIRNYGEGDFGRIIDNGKIQFTVTAGTTSLSGDTNGSSAVASATGSIQKGIRYFVSMTWTLAGAINFYINGVLSGTANQGGGTTQAGTTNLFIGNRNDGDRDFFGNMDEIRIYNRVLSAQELMTLYTKNTVPSGCTAEYLFNEGSGTTANDTVGGHTGTITGATYSTSAPINLRTIATNRTSI